MVRVDIQLIRVPALPHSAMLYLIQDRNRMTIMVDGTHDEAETRRVVSMALDELRRHQEGEQVNEGES